MESDKFRFSTELDPESGLKIIVCKICSAKIEVGQVEEPEKTAIAQKHLIDSHGQTVDLALQSSVERKILFSQ